MNTSDGEWVFYIVRCKDNSLYSGMTNNLEERIKKHNDGTGAKYTSSHRPVVLVHSEQYDSPSEAKKREGEVKSWPKRKKAQLISKPPGDNAHGSHDVTPARRPRYPMPDFILKSLDDRGLVAPYKSRPPYQQNDYIGWITRAKREETRLKRLNQMLAELEEGQHYMGMAYRAGITDTEDA
jgi:predicted GIY-YIG superfamily endonuclease